MILMIRKRTNAGFTIVEVIISVVIFSILVIGMQIFGRSGLLMSMMNSGGWEQDAMRSARDMMTQDMRQAGKALPAAVPAILGSSNSSQVNLVVGVLGYAPQLMVDGDRNNSTGLKPNLLPIHAAAFIAGNVDIEVQDGSKFSQGDLIILFNEDSKDFVNAEVMSVTGNFLDIGRGNIPATFQVVVSCPTASPAEGLTKTYVGSADSTKPDNTFVFKYRQITYARKDLGSSATTYDGELVRIVYP